MFKRHFAFLTQMALKSIGPMRLPALLRDGNVKTFHLYTYTSETGSPISVLEYGKIRNPPLLRIHSACSFAHVFNSQRCDCKSQLDEALLRIVEDGGGLFIYLWGHEGRAVGLLNHTRVYMEQDRGKDTVSAYESLGLPVDSRDYSEAVEILKKYGITSARLLTNNPRKIEPLVRAGIDVRREPLIPILNPYNESQVRVKKEKLGHLL